MAEKEIEIAFYDIDSHRNHNFIPLILRPVTSSNTD